MDSFNTYYLRFSEVKHIADFWINRSESYILPVIVITIAYAGIYFRNVRRSMVEQLNEDYVLYLRASGVKSITLMLHVLRNALQVAVSIFCMSIPMIMGGLVVIEYIFAWPGLGQLSLKAILEHDFPVIQAYVLIIYCI